MVAGSASAWQENIQDIAQGIDTLAGAVSSNKQAVKAGSGDFATGAIVDLASILAILQPSDITVLASASRTTTQTQADQTRPVGVKGIRVTLDMTDITASPSVTLEIDAKDSVSGKYVALLTGAAVTTVSTNVYVIYPTITAIANSIAQTALPLTWRVKVTANNANAGIYSVGASYLY